MEENRDVRRGYLWSDVCDVRSSDDRADAQASVCKSRLRRIRPEVEENGCKRELRRSLFRRRGWRRVGFR
jgi:hypothetical protein